MSRESSIDGPVTVPTVQSPTSSRAGHWIGYAPLLVSGLLLVIKLALVRRINVNWDEFLFLSQVHALVRGELVGVFQSAYTHLFVWLPAVGDEMAQIITARWLMMALLAATVVLMVRLASRWASPAAVWLAPVCYLTTTPVLTHGGSFRADSLIAPLSLAVLVLLTQAEQRRRTVVFAGVCLGAAIAISVKAIFVVPIVLALELVRTPGERLEWRVVSGRLVRLAVVAALLAGGLLAAHAWSVSAAAANIDAQGFATSVARKTLLDAPFLPRWDHLRVSLARDKASWILLAIGVIFALRQRRWAALACALSLAPLLVYRNAFPYYYVVMLAPACVLAAVAGDGLRAIAARRDSGAPRAAWVPAAICLPLLLQGAVRVLWLAPDAQHQQRETIAAVHKIFPMPVPYIDHSGMIASFRKVNFFMSTWGVESYRAAGKSFMRDALARYRPPLLLVNRGELDPDAYQFGWLLPEDQALIQEFYVPYWGPIRVAGAHVQIPRSGSIEAHLPFPGRYRLEAATPVRIDGISRANGEVLVLQGDSCLVSAEGATADPVWVRFVWADAAPAPAAEPPREPIYAGL